MIKNCTLCPRNCKKERNFMQGKGFCLLPDKIYLAHYGLHNYEEPPISGNNGSGTIFFSGCNLKCEYCQNFKISQKVCGKPFSVKEFINIIKKLENMGAENINLVSPTPYSNKIIEALKLYKPKIPVVYNTSGYENPKIIKKLLPYVDIFLTDFKYSNNEISKNLSSCDNYVENATESLKIMLQKPIIFDDKQMMKSGVIVRHLILPSMLENTFGVFEILSSLNVPLLSLMAQFTPINKESKINRTLTKREYNKVLNKLYEYDFDGFVQDLDSSGIKYVPNFSLIN